MSESNSFTVSMNGADVETNLAELAGLDISAFAEDAGEMWRCPVGRFRFEVKNAKIDKMGDSPAVVFDTVVAHCFALSSETDTPESTVGKEVRFPFFLGNMEKGVGQAVFLMNHAGLQSTATGLQPRLDAFCGMLFDANVRHERNKSDPDKPYVKLDLKSVAPAA